MGTTHVFFQSLGSSPVSIESWNSLVRTGVISSSTVLRTKAGIESGPVAFSVFRSFNSLFTALGSMMFCIDPKGLTPLSGMLEESLFVKTDLTCSFSIFALLELSLFVNTSLFLSGVTPEASCPLLLMKLQDHLGLALHGLLIVDSM